MIRKAIFLACSLFYSSQILACDEYASILQQRTVLGAVLENPNYDLLIRAKDVYKRISSTCRDPLDTLDISLKVSELQIMLGTELLEAEKLLLELEKKLVKEKDYYRDEYQKVIGQLYALYGKAGRDNLARLYANRIIREPHLYDAELRLDALATIKPSQYQFESDRIRLTEAIGQDSVLFFSSVIVPYRLSSRYLRFLQSLVEKGAYRELQNQSKALSSSRYLKDDVTYVSDNLLSISITEEVSKLAQSPHSYRLPRELKYFLERNPTNISLENQLLIELLSAFGNNSEKKRHLEQALNVFNLILSTYDYGRQIKLKPQINTVLAFLIKQFPRNWDVKNAVFTISQHLFVSNPVAPIMKLEQVDKAAYKRLVRLQQKLETQLTTSGNGNDKLIQDIAQLASEFKASSRNSVRSLQQVQAILAKDETLLYAVDLNVKSVLFYITAERVSVKVLTRQTLLEDINQHRGIIIKRKDARQSGAMLTHLLGLNKVRTPNLVVVAFGSVESLPISTLYNEENQRWAIEDLHISRFSLLDRVSETEAGAQVANKRIVISDPVFYLPPPKGYEQSDFYESYKTVLQLEKLPPSIEMESLALVGNQVSGQRELLTQDAAIESRVKKTLSHDSWNFISFSTHTVFPSKKDVIPYPGLAMSIDFSDPNNDSILQADEIAGLSMENSSVLLAACNTANASDVGGSFNSLITSFQFAGANNIIASQWNVYSNETVDFMTQVAALMNTGKYTPQSAVREVQLKLAVKLSKQTDSASVWGAWEIYL